MLNLSELQKLFPNAKYGYLEAIIGYESNLAQMGITENKLRLTHFLAQAAAETGGFTIKEENGNYSPEGLLKIFHKYFKSISEARAYAHKPQAIFNKTYGGRLGNTFPGDGYKYRGRGVFQITGKGAYKEYGDKIGVDLVSNPDQAGEPNISIQLATHYWSDLKLNDWADKDDILAVSRGINGGSPKRNIQPNGMSDRKSWYARIKKAFSDEGEKDTSPVESGSLAEGSSGDEVKRLQSALRAKGYQTGSIDGIFGASTARAIKAFQLDHYPDTINGIWLEDYWPTLENAPNIQAERADITASDLHQAGDPLVTQATYGQRLLSWFGLGALVTGGTSSVSGSFPELVTQYQPVIDTFRPAVQWAANNGWLLVIIAAIAGWLILRNIIKAAVKAYKHGDYQGPYKEVK